MSEKNEKNKPSTEKLRRGTGAGAESFSTGVGRKGGKQNSTGGKANKWPQDIMKLNLRKGFQMAQGKRPNLKKSIHAN